MRHNTKFIGATAMLAGATLFLALTAGAAAQSMGQPDAAKAAAEVAKAPVAAPATELNEKQLAQAQSRGTRLAGSLRLQDQEKLQRVQAIMADHFAKMELWHQTNDPRLNELWSAWSAARSTGAKDENKALLEMYQIDHIYSSFKPQHYAFLAQLAAELTPEQIERVKDQMTSSPGMMRTYNAYLEMVPEFTPVQKEWILGQMWLAREEAMDSTTSKEVINLFKKHKLRVEAYIDAQGYDYRARYKAFANRGKPAAAKSDAPKTEAAKPAETK